MKDRKLAERRLKEIKEKIGLLSTRQDAKLTFQEVAKNRWLESTRLTLAGATIVQMEIRINLKTSVEQQRHEVTKGMGWR